MSIIIDVFLDAFLDTIKLIPFLFLTYFLMEYLEHRTKAATQQMVKKSRQIRPAHWRYGRGISAMRFFCCSFGFLCRRSHFCGNASGYFSFHLR